MDVYNTILSETFLNIVAAIIIILFGLIFGGFFGKLIKKILKELEVNRILKEQTKKRIPLEEFLSSLVKYVVYFIAVVMALNQLGLTTVILYVILIVVLVLLIAFVILAVKDFVPNFISGFFIHQKRSINVGDKIKVREIEGKVVDINLVETKIKTPSGDFVYIPNSMLTKELFVKKK